jgi:TonB family protein
MRILVPKVLRGGREREFRRGTKRTWHESQPAGQEAMPDAARVAQAHALEVPIVLRGAKKSPDSDKPELFTETARTVLVFENGAVLHLHSKLAVGQTVSIHNTQNGQEVVCKVLEAPSEGELGLTDLEFTTVMPDFWGVHLGAPPAATPRLQAPADRAPDEAAKMVAPSGNPADDSLAMMLETASKIDVGSMSAPGKETGLPLREELMSAHDTAPNPSDISVALPDFQPAATNDAPHTEPTGEQIDAALKQMSGAIPLTGSETDGSSDEKHIAALMARDARLAKFAAFKEKQQAEKSQRGSAPGEPPLPATSEKSPELAAEPESGGEVRTIASKPSVVELLTTGKNATYVSIAACALIAVAIFFIWRAMHVPPVPDSLPSAAATSQPAPGGPATPSSEELAEPPLPNGSPARGAAPRPEFAGGPGSRNRDEDEESDGSRRRRAVEAAAPGVAPARVLSQPQPTLPPWAVGVELDGVVTLDVTIDERGNVSGSKVVSGPRPLQREAERAIGLWQFAPARLEGKPVPSHMTLSVEFLPPPASSLKRPPLE